MIILKVTKNQGFTLSVEDTFFEKPQGGSNWPPPPSRFRVNLFMYNVVAWISTTATVDQQHKNI